MKAGRLQLEPTFEVFNVTNSGVVLNQLTAFGASLDKPGQTLNGRPIKLGVRVKF